MSWTHTPASSSTDVLIAYLGNKVVDVVMLPVDDDGMPV
jgi:hypothetical protein